MSITISQNQIDTLRKEYFELVATSNARSTYSGNLEYQMKWVLNVLGILPSKAEEMQFQRNYYSIKPVHKFLRLNLKTIRFKSLKLQTKKFEGSTLQRLHKAILDDTLLPF